MVFSVFMMFTYFAVLNVVTGVFCQSAIESANQDKDTLVQTQLSLTTMYTEQLEKLFTQIAQEDACGYITLSMFEESLEDDQVKAYFDGLDLTTDDAWNLFKLLDSNESNSIDLEEFVAGCLRLRGRARSIDIHMLLYESRWIMKRVDAVVEVLRAFMCRRSQTDFSMMAEDEQPEASSECKMWREVAGQLAMPRDHRSWTKDAALLRGHTTHAKI
mmetsp:Transcript_25899/g.34989  ORF Transcript_25899/g.34989 Transcript_25899/m.34989 type:complete len:216 (+) Transcript_25899:3-650(+)